MVIVEVECSTRDKYAIEEGRREQEGEERSCWFGIAMEGDVSIV